MLLKVVSYRAEWPRIFSDWKRRIDGAISMSNSALDHVGSTAVPDLEAKPIIDIQLSVPSIDEAKARLTSDLEPLGFEFRPGTNHDRPPPWLGISEKEWRKLYFRTSLELDHPVHLHVRTIGSSNARYALLFRDYLRANGVARTAYGKFKLLLSEQTAETSAPGGTGSYQELKDPIFDLLYHAAELWAQQVNWRC